MHDEATAQAADDPANAATVPSGTAAASMRARLLNAARYVLVAVVIAVAGYYLAANWDDVLPYLRELTPATILLALASIVVSIGCATMSWQVLVDDLGRPIGAGRGAQVFLVGQLGKYMPGSVWAYLLQLELGRKAGLARARVFTATVFSILVAIVAALLAGAMAVPQLVAENPSLSWVYWLYLMLPVAVAVLHPRVLTAAVRVGFKVLRRPNPDHPVSYPTVLRSLGWAVGSYLASGTHLWLLARSGVPVGIGTWLLCAGTMAIAMLVSLFAFVLPSGAGVREIVIVSALAPTVGVHAATAYAAVSRLLFIVADLLTAGGAAGLAVWARRTKGHYHGDPGID